MPENVTVIGAGLAGSEATWQLAKRGIHVDLYEMRPKKKHQLMRLVNLQSWSVLIQ